MSLFLKFLVAAVAAGTPLLFGTVGEILNEKVGHLNLGVEGMMALGACAGFMTAYLTDSLALALLGFALGSSLHPQSAAGIPVLLFLAFISGAGYVLWALLMKNNPVSRISVFGLIIPVMSVLLSALLNGEPLWEWNYLAALALVCGGIFLVNRAPRPKTE